MPKPHNIASFMLRFTQELWQDTNGEPHVRWRGHIRHVQGEEEARFTDFADAITFMQRYLTRLTMETMSGAQNTNQEKVLTESFKLWSQFAASYTDLMTQAMEQSLRQSENLREQVDEASKKVIDVWQTPYVGYQSEVLDTLKKLNSQVEVLTERIKALEEQNFNQK
jgi:L-2-hydroxyglutarate oxidase LhgO